MGKNVREAMTANPRSVEPSVPVAEAARLMRSEDVGSLPVVEGERLVGIITDRDIVVRVVAEGRDPESTNLSELISRDLVTVRPDEDLDEALKLMARHQVRRLPVVEDGGRLIGIVAQADVAQEADEAKVGRTVEEVSR
jgi:CBS domain-containing protein